MIRRYFAKKDNTITNAFEENLTTRGTGSNMGASDILEVFSIYAQASGSDGFSSELSRVLIEFDISDISADRTTGLVPASGSVSWYLNMYNVPHSRTVPSDITLQVSAISESWEEGYGLDMEHYEDLTRDSIGSNWIRRTGSTSWATAGGDYLTDTSSSFTQTFSTGLEDLSVDVTTLVEQWIDSAGNVLGSKDNYGFGIKLTDALESASKSFFTKRFFGRDTEFHFQKPVLEARWDSARQDDRGSFYMSSSLASSEDNLNTIYIYNSIRGKLSNIPGIGTGPIGVSIFSSSAGSPSGPALTLVQDGANVAATSPLVVTGGYVSTGIYSASFAFTGSDSLDQINDVWFKMDGSITNAAATATQYVTGTIALKSFTSLGYNPETSHVISMPRLKKQYRKNQTHRLDLYIREKNWSPNIHTVAVQSSIASLIIPSASYQVRRSIDDYVVVPYGTGSTMHTALSYDVSGNYFDLDTTYLETGYLYEIQYSFYDEENGWEEQPYRFKFRVVD